MWCTVLYCKRCRKMFYIQTTAHTHTHNTYSKCIKFHLCTLSVLALSQPRECRLEYWACNQYIIIFIWIPMHWLVHQIIHSRLSIYNAKHVSILDIHFKHMFWPYLRCEFIWTGVPASDASIDRLVNWSSQSVCMQCTMYKPIYVCAIHGHQ